MVQKPNTSIEPFILEGVQMIPPLSRVARDSNSLVESSSLAVFKRTIYYFSNDHFHSRRSMEEPQQDEGEHRNPGS